MYQILESTNISSSKLKIDCSKECPCGVPVIPVPDQWLEVMVTGKFKVWHIIFIIIALLVTLIVVYCCFHRCRIPRTKQEIEADLMKTNLTNKFRDYLQQLPNEQTTFIEALKKVQDFEEKLEKDDELLKRDLGARKRMKWLNIKSKDKKEKENEDKDKDKPDKIEGQNDDLDELDNNKTKQNQLNEFKRGKQASIEKKDLLSTVELGGINKSSNKDLEKGNVLINDKTIIDLNIQTNDTIPKGLETIGIVEAKSTNPNVKVRKKKQKPNLVRAKGTDLKLNDFETKTPAQNDTKSTILENKSNLETQVKVSNQSDLFLELPKVQEKKSNHSHHQGRKRKERSELHKLNTKSIR